MYANFSIAIVMTLLLTFQTVIAGESGETQAETPVIVHSEPADTEPVGTEPVGTEPADTEPADTEPAVTEPTVIVVEEEFLPPPENQWEKFKFGARQAGDAIAKGSKNTARKVSKSAKKAGHAIADGYEDVKEYVEEEVK